ncbi:MAG: HAD-IA family hydrolase [Kiloniellaceae bacterium]
MSHTFRLIVFDLDGTLVDSQHVIVRAMSEAFAAHHLPRPAAEAVRRVVGLKLEFAVARLLPDPDDWGTAARVAERYREAFLALRARPDYHEPLFPGAREVLALLDRPEVCLGIATGKNRRGLMASLERHGLAHHFVTLQTADDGPGKPHPEMLHCAMADAGAGPDETVLIGDTTFDMEMACHARARGIGVAWGYHDPAELRASGAVRVIETFDDLPPTLSALGAHNA